MDDVVQKRLRLGAVGSLGAVTLLWLAGWGPAWFTLGTVLLTVSMVPLAAGFRARGGLLLGSLYGVLWVAARTNVSGSVQTVVILSPANVVSVVAMMVLGALSGAFFGLPRRPIRWESEATGDGPKGKEPSPLPVPPREDPPDLLADALRAFRKWSSEWAERQNPWPSFDNHVRELLRQSAGARRVRCFHVDPSGALQPLNRTVPADPSIAVAQQGLLQHVVTTGRRFVAFSPNVGQRIQELAHGSGVSYAWVFPIRYRDRTCGLVTVGEFENRTVGEARLEVLADLVEEFWQHLKRADDLRTARLLDRPSGVLNRVEVLAVLDRTVERCYADHEPVVMLALVVEGIRHMDDGGQWDTRNEVVETIGQTMRSRLRHDDLVGRFSDDRFIAVLRRLDVALAHLITCKIVEAIRTEVQRRFPDMPLSIRAGLAGSGFERVPPQTLLLKAFASITEARAQQLAILPYSREGAAVAVNA